MSKAEGRPLSDYDYLDIRSQTPGYPQLRPLPPLPDGMREKIIEGLGALCSQLLTHHLEKIDPLFENDSGKYTVGECISPALTWQERDSYWCEPGIRSYFGQGSSQGSSRTAVDLTILQFSTLCITYTILSAGPLRYASSFHHHVKCFVSQTESIQTTYIHALCSKITFQLLQNHAFNLLMLPVCATMRRGGARLSPTDSPHDPSRAGKCNPFRHRGDC